MNNNTKVTIITSTFNAERYLDQTIQSVLSQTYPFIEYIIIDGGSSDHTLSIINTYEGQISKIVSEPDKGIYDAWNKGLRLATGDLIGFIGADDWYDQQAISKIVSEFNKQKNKRVIYGSMTQVTSNGCKIRVKQSNEKNLKRRMDICHPTLFVCRSLLKNRSFDIDFKISGDYEMMLYLYKIASTEFLNVHDNIAFMREGGVSDKFSSILKVIKEDHTARKRYLSFNEVFIALWIDLFIKLPKKTIKYIFEKFIRRRRA